MTLAMKLDKTTPLSVLKALALSLARDIDNREDAETARERLEEVFALIPNAPQPRFA